MKVIVDTCVWSIALRRSKKKYNQDERILVDELGELIEKNEVAIIGPIRQEVLSGIKHDNQFIKLKRELQIFKDITLTTDDYTFAAKLYNKCKSNGITATPGDIIICAAAINHGLCIFTIDNDFNFYSKLLNINIYTRKYN